MSLDFDPDGPTSTTKALLVSVIAPRVYSVKQKRAVDGTNRGNGIYDAMAAAVDTSALVDMVVGRDSSKQLIDKEEKIKRESSSSDDEYKTPLFIQSLSSVDVDVSEDENESDGGDSDEEKEEEPTAEEEAAVKKNSFDPDDAEIDIEELLRITFQSLLEGWHLLNFPVYTTIHRRIEDTKASGATSMRKAGSEDSIMTWAWVQVQVMARPASLGTVLDRLERIGVGTDTGTVSVFRAELCRTASPYANLPIPTDRDKSTGSGTAASTSGSHPTLDKDGDVDPEAEGPSEEEQERHKNERMNEEAQQEWKNAATKLQVEQVREQIGEQAALSFDFLALLTVASILGGVGLVTDNTVVIVASMLVSPIMGPVLGCTFGSRIYDWELVKSSFVNYILALFGCVIIGVMVGIGSSFTTLAEDWPTNEMLIRGEPSGLITGIAIAIPSGMGVSLSILGGHTSSLVGVAISASLLPPPVNTGVCFVYSIFLAAGAVTNTNKDQDAYDFFVIGGISLALTIVNVICIWLSGLLMFEIKEVAPTKQKSAFWANGGTPKERRRWRRGVRSTYQSGTLEGGVQAGIQSLTA